MRRRLLFLLLAALFSGSLHAQITETALLDTVQYTAFRFFWDEANPSNGLIRDRASIGSSSYISWVPSSIASCGFGLSAICIGVDHGWVTRAIAADRVVTMLRTFWNGPQGAGSNYIGAYGLVLPHARYDHGEAHVGQRALDDRHGVAVRRHRGCPGVL